MPRISILGDRRQVASSGFCSAADKTESEVRLSALTDPLLNLGDPVYFDVAPATIPLNRKVPIRIRNLTVLGDYPQIQVSLLPGGPERVFDRLETRTIDGELVSLFDVTFPRGDLSAAVRPAPMRFDHTDRGTRDTTGFIRLRPSTIPKTRVVRINDRVQYSSHVVNIVVPYDGLSVFALPGEQIAAEFYRYFSDTYEELAFVPQRSYWSPCCGARHQFVYQDIDGIGLDRMDARSSYAGSTVLRDWIFYIRGDLQSNFLSVHETGHNWGWFMSLFDAAGVELEGSTDCAGLEFDGTSVHAPLFADGHTFLGQCIWSPLYVSKQGGNLRLDTARPPLVYHPLTLYAMGLIEASDVPTMYLSKEQGVPRSYAPGTPLEGGFTEVTMADVVRHHGERRGPAVPALWRRAVIVVSPERLLRARDLRWFNYYAKRISDPEVTGIESLAGVPSIEVATQGMVDVRTEIRPRSHPQVSGDFPVSFPEVGKRDVLGLKLKQKLPSRYETGRAYVVSGQVKQPGPYETVSVRIGTRIFSAEIGADRRFSLEIEMNREDRGRHWLTVWLGDFELELARIAPVYVD